MTLTDSKPHVLVRAYRMLIACGSHLQSLVLLVVRLAWGWELYLSGFRHLHNVQAMVERFHDWGVPYPHLSVLVSGSTEMVGGVLLMLGFGARLISIPLLFNFCVAYATASVAKLHQLAHGGDLIRGYDPGRLQALEAIINDDAFPFFITTLLMVAFGPGKVSIDYLLKRTIFRPARPTIASPPDAPAETVKQL